MTQTWKQTPIRDKQPTLPHNTHFIMTGPRRHNRSRPSPAAGGPRGRPRRLHKYRSGGRVRCPPLTATGRPLEVLAVGALAVAATRHSGLEALAVLLQAGGLFAVATGVVRALAADAPLELADECRRVAFNCALNSTLFCARIPFYGVVNGHDQVIHPCRVERIQDGSVQGKELR